MEGSGSWSAGVSVPAAMVASSALGLSSGLGSGCGDVGTGGCPTCGPSATAPPGVVMALSASAISWSTPSALCSNAFISSSSCCLANASSALLVEPPVLMVPSLLSFQWTIWPSLPKWPLFSMVDLR
ncbi:Uncharacterised protein [Mycobacteroides abscessus subsp. abscessus]|nr:Uncharacterised protein [Mycobacteroides abscessus subsp. abscessus]